MTLLACMHQILFRFERLWGLPAYGVPGVTQLSTLGILAHALVKLAYSLRLLAPAKPPQLLHALAQRSALLS